MKPEYDISEAMDKLVTAFPKENVSMWVCRRSGHLEYVAMIDSIESINATRETPTEAVNEAVAKAGDPLLVRQRKIEKLKQELAKLESV